MVLKGTRWEIPLLIVVVFSALGGFGVASFQILDWEVGESAMWVLPLGLATAYMLSERRMQRMSNVETFSFVIPVAIVFGYELFNPVQDLANSFNPYFGLGMVSLAIFAFYALTNEDL